MNRFSKLAVYAAGTAVTFFLFSGVAFAGSYTVASNDSLYKIGALFGSSAAEIKSDNGLRGDLIYPGQVLGVRAPTYTVKSGDSLYLIAKRYGLSLYSLRKANNFWGNSIYPGQKLLIPNGGAAGSGTRASAAGSTAGTVSQSDMDLLARLVTAEADGEPYDAQVGVAAVVLNRVRSADFPGTVQGVIYQKSDGFYQFTPVENGFINKPASDVARKAVADAVKGYDPSKGALYYFDDSATNKWLWSKPLLAYIGHMVFVY